MSDKPLKPTPPMFPKKCKKLPRIMLHVFPFYSSYQGIRNAMISLCSDSYWLWKQNLIGYNVSMQSQTGLRIIWDQRDPKHNLVALGTARLITLYSIKLWIASENDIRLLSDFLLKKNTISLLKWDKEEVPDLNKLNIKIRWDENMNIPKERKRILDSVEFEDLVNVLYELGVSKIPLSKGKKLQSLKNYTRGILKQVSDLYFKYTLKGNDKWEYCVINQEEDI